jgi:LmbE family N-acetylglucosaminyl deacetylase
MASRHVPRYFMYRSNYYDVDQPFDGNFYSDVTDVMEKKIEVAKAHKSELERVRYAWLEFFKKQNENDGQKIGVKFAESFKVIRYLI